MFHVISPLLLFECAAPVFVSPHETLDHQSCLAELLFPQSFQVSVAGILKYKQTNN